jgi:hypothetical protein
VAMITQSLHTHGRRLNRIKTAALMEVRVRPAEWAPPAHDTFRPVT